MADGGLLVTISGAALSLLLYENVRCVGDQMGFLLGEIVEYIVKKFTDSDKQVETVKIHINIETVVTCSLPDILHDSTGRIDKEKLKDFLSDKGKEVIGWFRFRHNACLVPTLRDKLLHKQFASHFSDSHGHREDFFVTCLLSSSLSHTSGTHKFRHVLLRRKGGSFEPISLKINSLGDGGSTLDGSDYKLTPVSKSIKETDTFTKIVQSLKLDLGQTTGVESATIIEREAEKYLNKLIPEVCESDSEVFKLEKQVAELKAKLLLQSVAAKAKINGNSKTTESYCEINRNSGYKENDPSLEKVDSSNKIYEDDQPYKYHSLTDTSRDYRPGSTKSISTESVSQEKLRMEVDMDTSNSQARDPFAPISDAKLGMIGSTLNRNKGSPNMISEIARQPINMGDHIESGVGRGSPKYGHDVHSLRKTRRGSAISRNSSERNVGEPSEKTLVKNIVQNQEPPIYEEISKRNLDNMSDTSDIQ